MRKDIIYFLDRKSTTDTLYDELKCCLILDETSPQNIDSVDPWFKGVIQSLFYNPNENILVLFGDQAIGKTEFFRRLLPKPDWFSHSREPYGRHPNIYKHLLVDMTDYDTSLVKDIASNDGFVINSNTKETNKRLASVCYTSNSIGSGFLNRRRSICLFLKNIDKIRFNSIDKTKLWIEIFNRFK
jgi:hypothetical protein